MECIKKSLSAKPNLGEPALLIYGPFHEVPLYFAEKIFAKLGLPKSHIFACHFDLENELLKIQRETNQNQVYVVGEYPKDMAPCVAAWIEVKRGCIVDHQVKKQYSIPISNSILIWLNADTWNAIERILCSYICL